MLFDHHILQVDRSVDNGNPRNHIDQLITPNILSSCFFEEYMAPKISSVCWYTCSWKLQLSALGSFISRTCMESRPARPHCAVAEFLTPSLVTVNIGAYQLCISKTEL